MSKLKVVSVRWWGAKGGLLDDVWIETDELNGCLSPFSTCFAVFTGSYIDMASLVDGWDMPPDEVSCYDKVVIDLWPHLEEIHEAMNRVYLEALEVEKVTILNGKVAAHPPARQHYLCPFCYPKE